MMDFISLDEALRGIAASVKALPHYKHETKFPDNIFQVQVAEFWNNEAPRIEEERRFSTAAQSLNEALHHSGNCPKLFSYDEVKKFAVKDDNGAIAAEVNDILTQLTGLHDRANKIRLKHIDGCERNNRNPVTQSIGGMADTSLLDGFLRRLEICFDHAEFAEFLEGNKIAHTLPSAEEQAAPVDTVKQVAPIPIVRQRCNTILSWLQSKNYDPQNLPAPLKNGLPTIKNTCRTELLQNKKMFSSRGLFDKAWQQLRTDGDLKGLK